MADAAKEDQRNLEYIREHKMHLLFEQIAGVVLQVKPPKLEPFIIEWLSSRLPKGEAVPGPPQPQQEAKQEQPQTQPQPQPEQAQAVPDQAKLEEGGKIGDGAKYDPTMELRDGDPTKKMKVTIAVFGIGGAGKSTLISGLGGEVDRNTTPTIGFDPVRMSADKFDIMLYDLGGGRKIRGVWSSYFADLHGIIYVVDASDADGISESVDAVQTILKDERSKGKPILFLANKQDKTPALAADVIAEKFSTASLEAPSSVVACCALEPSHPTHANIELGMAWLLEAISSRFEELSRRIKEQIAIDKANRKKAFEEQKERVRLEKEAEEAGKAG